MFMAVLFRIAKSRNHPEVHQLTHWIKQMEYYSVINRNGVLTHATV